MVEKAKIFYFGVFILVVFAFIFHVTAMGFPHWKKADLRNSTYDPYGLERTTVGLFTRCVTTAAYAGESCYPNVFSADKNCSDCSRTNTTCSCDYLPSTKGIAACSIIASIFLGLAIIILFIHSVNTSETRTVGMFLGILPLIFLLLAWIFILITLILVGSYLSRDVMEYIYRNSAYNGTNYDVTLLREAARGTYVIRVDWSTGLDIIALIFTFFAFLFYNAFVFKFGRS